MARTSGPGKRHFKGNNKSLDKNRRRENAEKWKQTRGDDANRNGYDTPTTNVRMEAFYKAQRFVDESEWDSFLTALRSPLPACFRINQDYLFAQELTKQLHDHVGQSFSVDGVNVQAVEQLKWYPNGMGYKLGTDRRNLRKMPALNQLHQWMIRHTDSGNITRQEAVSMVPPLALNVEPHHQCLDMCAAPGSKTSQLLEVIDRSSHEELGRQGCVVANDADTDRAYMLVHQCKRINSPLLVVSTHKGQLFPSIDEYFAAGQPADSRPRRDGYFDRVLCDVPCSGDGTLRKNPCIWAKWATASAITIHPLQLQIALRGLQLLKTGGLMVYSTCSMSPYEDEAVVAELLRSSKGTLELVDARQFLPLFKARPGLSTWHVLDDYSAIKKAYRDRKNAARKQRAAEAATSGGSAEGAEGADKAEDEEAGDAQEGQEEDADEAPAEARAPHSDPLVEACLEMGMELFPDFSSVPTYLDKKIRKSLFPPSAEELEWMHLEYCLRCVPHDEDTGGFFVATLRKIARPASTGADEAAAVDEEAEDAVPVEDEESAALDAAAAAAADTSTPEEGGCVVDSGEPEVVEDGQPSKRAKTEEGEAVPSAAVVPQRPKPESQKGLVDFKQWDVACFEKVRDFYGIADTLPAESFFVREDFSTTSSTGVSAKSVYYIPAAVRRLMRGDRDQRLKIVSAGIKVFEKKVNTNGSVDYRLVQEGLFAIMPHITKRKVHVSAQDFSNLLGGGLVSFNTLSHETVKNTSSMSPGALIAVYTFSSKDVIANVASASSDATVEVAATAEGADATAPAETESEKMSVEDVASASEDSKHHKDHSLYTICWRGTTRTLNVMCGKTEIQSMKHQLEAMRVLRPRISVPKREVLKAVEGSAAVAVAVAGDAAVVVDGDASASVVVEESSASVVEMAVEEVAVAVVETA